MKDLSSDVEFYYNNFDNVLSIESSDLNPENVELGYCYRYQNIYSVVLKSTGDKYTDDCIKNHEFGHIYLGHLEGIHEKMDNILIDAITNDKDKLSDYINKSCSIDYADKLLDRLIEDKFLNHRIHNIAMDMEVNSKVLDLSDIEHIERQVTTMMPKYQENFLKYIKSNLDDEKVKEEIDKYLEKLSKESKIKLIHPSRYHLPNGQEFPSELTYQDYLVLIVQNIDQFIKMMISISAGGNGDTSQVTDGDVANELSNKGMSGFDDLMSNSFNNSGSTESDNSEGNESSNKNKEENSSSNSSNSNNEEDTKSDSSNGGKIKKECPYSSDKSQSNDHRTESRDETDKLKDLGNFNRKGGSGRGTSGTSDIITKISYKDEVEMALEEVFQKFKSKVVKNDFTKLVNYKYNRGILRDIISPSYKLRVTLSKSPKVVFGIDVSGSMETDLVNRIMNSIAISMRKLNRGLRYDIITWNTELSEHIKDINPIRPPEKIKSGGGTTLAGLFDYFKDNYDKNSVLVIISDFEDNLSSWHEKELKMSEYDMYGFNYGDYDYYNINWTNLKVRNFSKARKKSTRRW